MQPCRGIAWLGSSRRSPHLREYPFRAPANLHRIGRLACLENHRPKDGIYTTGERSFPLHAEAAHLRLTRRLLCITALGARNVKTASWEKVLKFARSRLSATTYRASAALRRS